MNPQVIFWSWLGSALLMPATVAQPASSAQVHSSGPSPVVAVTASDSTLVSLDLHNVTLRDALDALYRKTPSAGGYVLDRAAVDEPTRISVTVSHLPFDVALLVILGMAGGTATRQMGIDLITVRRAPSGSPAAEPPLTPSWGDAASSSPEARSDNNGTMAHRGITPEGFDGEATGVSTDEAVPSWAHLGPSDSDLFIRRPLAYDDLTYVDGLGGYGSGPFIGGRAPYGGGPLIGAFVPYGSITFTSGPEGSVAVYNNGGRLLGLLDRGLGF